MDKASEKKLPENEDSDESMDESDDDEEAAMAKKDSNRSFKESLSDLLPQSLQPGSIIDRKSEDPTDRIIFNPCEYSFNNLSTTLYQKNNLVILEFVNCSIESFNDKTLPPISTIKEITFNNCKSSFIEVFTNQNSLEKITIIVDKLNLKEFPHDAFNKICENCKSLKHIVLKGAGTGGYFDCDEFPYKITKLEATMITHHWYVGLTEAPLNFLQEQTGSLKELTIDELPYDFKGGEVLKYIIEEMNLDKFYYGKIPLILSGKKQKVKEFSASEIQITSAYEFLRQFPSIEKFTLNLSNTDISSDAIERIINPTTDIFNNINEFEVIDNSSYLGIFGVFLGLYRNLKNICKLTLRTQDRNINTILESLPIMHNLEEIQLTSTAPEASERYKRIEELAPNLKIIKVADNNVEGAGRYFQGRGRVQVDGIEEPNDARNVNDPPEGEGDNLGGNRGRGRDDDDESNSFEGFTPESVTQGKIVLRTEQSPVRSSFEDQDLIQDVANYKIHAFGYYKNILNQRNVKQLNELLGEIRELVVYLRTEQGKIAVRLHNNTVDNLNTFKNKLRDLAYIEADKTIQLPLIILSANERIRLFCIVENNGNWKNFLKQIPGENELSGSLWTFSRIDNVSVDARPGFKITFNVDARSYTKIQEKNFTLKYYGNNVTIIEVTNPYTHDMRLLSMLPAIR